MTQTDSPERIAEGIVADLRACDPTIVYDGAKVDPIKAAIAQALADERRRVREECAGIAEGKAPIAPGNFYRGQREMAATIASAIRAAGKE